MGKSHRSKASLKSSLASHQCRLKSNEKAQSTLKRRELLSNRGPGAKATIDEKRKAKPLAMPFSATDRILLIGEGDFSFASALIKHDSLRHLPPENLIATAYDSEEICLEKYPDALNNMATLRTKGVKVLFDVDGTSLERCSLLKNTKWSRIVWNFPHAGKGISDQDRNILANQKMLLGFFRSAAMFLSPGPAPQAHTKKRRRKNNTINDVLEDSMSEGDDNIAEQTSGARGTLLVTLRNGRPYTDWDMPNLAKKPPPSELGAPKYHVMRSFVFPTDGWRKLGYEHRMTKGFVEGTGTGGDRARALGKSVEDRCWEFYLDS